jgi:undecaprenyl-diphosphatase
MLWLGASGLAIGLFVVITHELLERDVGALDRALLVVAAGLRRPRLNAIMVDVTSLGSGTFITLFTIVALGVLAVLRDWRGAVQLIAASVGSGLWILVTKDVIDRARPTQVSRLVDVQGFSYPSGHSLSAAAVFMTIAILAASHLRSDRARAALYAGTFALISLIGLSRIYLGVHYPSDVASGISLGLAWALLLAAGFAFIDRRPS